MAGIGMENVAKLSLYVGDLEKSVNEQQLYDIFSRVAPVVSVRVCRDQLHQTSLGYAYVNFQTPQDAANAREKLNFSPVNGKLMRIMFSHRDPSIRKSGLANIFIKNLDPAIDNKALFDTFTAFGNVLSCKVATDRSGQSKGYGFVQFDQEDAAQKAIKKLDGMLMNDKKVYVGLFVRRVERNPENGSRKFTNVYVKNFSEATSDDDLKNMFKKYGPITSAVVMKDANGQSRCFGFVNFENADDALAAVNGMNGSSCDDDKVLYVGKAQRKEEREAELRAKFEQERNSRFEKLQGANLYLKNLDDSIREEGLKEFFSEFGTITSCKIMYDAKGASKGSGFVAFSTAEEAARALNAMNGKLIGSKPLYVAVAQRKEERKAQLQARFAQIQAPMPLSAFHPGPSRLYYGHGAHGGLYPPQHPGYGYPQQFMPGMRPGVPPNFMVPMPFQRGQHGQRLGPRRGGNPRAIQQEQWMVRNNNREVGYNANGNRVNPSLGSQGPMIPIVPIPFDGQATSVDNQRPGQMPISKLASETLENQHLMLGEQLYPLVEQLEHENAGKVTGMLLEMDQTEVLHLIESPEALKKKVSEAIEALRAAAASVDSVGGDKQQ